MVAMAFRGFEGGWGVGGYLVPLETRAARISYRRGLFVEETARLWDWGGHCERISSSSTVEGTNGREESVWIGASQLVEPQDPFHHQEVATQRYER